MAKRLDRIDGFLGRLVYRLFGVLLGIVAIICGFATWWHVTNPLPDAALVPTVLFGLVTLAAASAVPFCFSRKRTFTEALDSIEGGPGDQRRPG